jgi:hypothetical protein
MRKFQKEILATQRLNRTIEIKKLKVPLDWTDWLDPERGENSSGNRL